MARYECKCIVFVCNVILSLTLFLSISRLYMCSLCYGKLLHKDCTVLIEVLFKLVSHLVSRFIYCLLHLDSGFIVKICML